jgi:hypothetical protein
MICLRSAILFILLILSILNPVHSPFSLFLQPEVEHHVLMLAGVTAGAGV